MTDVCRFCGSAELWSAHFDADGNGDPDGEYATLCQACGRFQDRPNISAAKRRR